MKRKDHIPKAIRPESRPSSRDRPEDTARALAASELRYRRLFESARTGGGTWLMVLMGLLALFAVVGVVYVSARITGGEHTVAEGRRVLAEDEPVLAEGKVELARGKQGLSEGEQSVSGIARVEAGQNRLAAGRLRLRLGRERLGQARHLRWALVVTTILFVAASLVLGFRRTRAASHDGAP